MFLSNERAEKSPGITEGQSDTPPPHPTPRLDLRPRSQHFSIPGGGRPAPQTPRQENLLIQDLPKTSKKEFRLLKFFSPHW